MNEMNARKIRSWMALHGIRPSDIARDLQVSRTMIGRFITGHSTSKRVFDHFMTLGCPKGYFADRPETRRKVQ